MATRRNKSAVDATDVQTAKDSLMKIEDDWMLQRLRGESHMTERLPADNYQGGTADGVEQSKTGFLHFIRAGHGVHESAQPLHRHIELHGQTAISTGMVVLKSSDRERRYRYL